MTREFDFVVIGSGPGGQKAAVGAAKAGQRVALIEQDRHLGGACVHYGTIPSKALREAAYRAGRLREARAEVDGADRIAAANVGIRELLGSVEDVISGYAATVKTQMERNGVVTFHGRGRFASPNEIEVRHRNGDIESLSTRFVILATGSRPRHPDGIPIDHEHVLDGDSILKLAYLPRSLAVLGGGVIACEYASVFASLGVEVTIIDRGERPLAFMDAEMTDAFQRDFETSGGRYLGRRSLTSIAFDGVSKVDIVLGEDERVCAEKVFVALGRSGCLEALNLEAAGLSATDRGLLEVGAGGATSVSHVYAVGDVAGPPALATSAMEQGRRAVLHALDLPSGRFGETIPTGIYAIPELASVGATEAQVRESLGDVAVGRAHFEELARGQISRVGRGFLKIVADPTERRILGVHAVGEGAAELIHVGQMAIIASASVEDLIENVFNFPTLTEAYRVAALDCVNQIEEARTKQTRGGAGEAPQLGSPP